MRAKQVPFRRCEKWYEGVARVLDTHGLAMLLDAEDEMDKRCRFHPEVTIEVAGLTVTFKRRPPDPGVACRCDTHCVAENACGACFKRAPALPPPEAQT